MWPSTNSWLTAHFISGLMSALMICQQRREWSYMTLNVFTQTNLTGVIKQHLAYLQTDTVLSSLFCGTSNITANFSPFFQFNIDHHVLLTGTPVQNNLRELFSLLCFVAPTIFKEKYTEQFIEHFSGVEDQSGE